MSGWIWIQTVGYADGTPKTMFLKFKVNFENNLAGHTVMPTKSDSYVILYLQLLSKTLTCTLHLS